MRTEFLTHLVRPLGTAHYGCDHGWRDVEGQLDQYARDYGLNLDPDFQRGHVWTREQQAHFIENVMRRVVSRAMLVIQFNCPYWGDSDYTGDLPREMQIVDGLQRLTAVREYLKGNVRPFGLSIDAFDRSDFDVRRRHYFLLRFEVHTFQTRKALLQHYLDLNVGGTPHAPVEIDRVRGLLAAA